MSDPGGPSPDAAAAQLLEPGEQMLCFACRAAGECQFGIRSVTPDGDQGRVLARLACPPRHEGGPQVAHGGWTAAVFDETLGHLGPLFGHLTVTATLTVDYLKPVPVGRDLELRAWVDRIEGRKLFAAGEMTLASSGALLGRAHGIFVIRDPSHFTRHQAWLAAQG